METYKVESWDRFCTMILVYSLPAEALSEINSQESRIRLSKISTSFLTFLIPFVIVKTEFWQQISSEFSNSALQWLMFSQPAGVHMINMKDLELIVALAIIKNSTIYFIREIWPSWITNSNFLLYLVWYFWRQDIKLKNSMKKNCQKESCSSGKYAEY